MHSLKPNLIIKLSYCNSLHLGNLLKERAKIRTAIWGVNYKAFTQYQVKIWTTTLNSTVLSLNALEIVSFTYSSLVFKQQAPFCHFANVKATLEADCWSGSLFRWNVWTWSFSWAFQEILWGQVNTTSAIHNLDQFSGQKLHSVRGGVKKKSLLDSKWRTGPGSVLETRLEKCILWLNRIKSLRERPKQQDKRFSFLWLQWK